MTSKELRTKFIEFFEKNNHKHLLPVGLVPTDKSVLFTTAGMQPLVPFLMGEKHPEGNRLVNIQRCIRTDDIDEVGDETHLTFFEMMGYWSLGDYWKKEAINFTFEFFTKELNIDIRNIAVTCFIGDEKNSIAKDTESAEIWQSLGIPEKRIVFLGYEDNFWERTGNEGPCGPDTEIFAWTGEGDAPEVYDPKNKKWVEIGNDVFMQYNKTADGKFVELKQKNVDFGAGFERITAFLEEKDNVFETELFQPILQKIEEISNKKYLENQKEFRIITDHIRTAVFAINDDVLPSNKESGYIVRRLIRRSIVKAYQLELKENFVKNLAQEVYPIYDNVYEFDQEKIETELEKEENKFRVTLSQGMHKIETSKALNSKMIFDLHQSFGLPLEVTQDAAKFYNIEIESGAVEEYQDLLKKHQDLSRTASAGMFKGGLAGGGEMETKYHTTTHLLLASLRKILGDDIAQKGSNITAERMRFDFNYSEKLTNEQIKEIEDEVNENIKADLLVNMQEMSLEDAESCGATGTFGDRYGEKVKVYSIGSPSTSSGSRDFVSREICGGPHVKNTGELGHFRIVKEESSSAGVRRIKAILQ